MKTFEVIAVDRINGNMGIVQTFEADYYRERWDFHFYKKAKHWWQPDTKIGQFPYFTNIIVREKQ